MNDGRSFPLVVRGQAPHGPAVPGLGLFLPLHLHGHDHAGGPLAASSGQAREDRSAGLGGGARRHRPDRGGVLARDSGAVARRGGAGVAGHARPFPRHSLRGGSSAEGKGSRQRGGKLQVEECGKGEGARPLAGGRGARAGGEAVERRLCGYDSLPQGPAGAHDPVHQGQSAAAGREARESAAVSGAEEFGD